MPIATPTDSMNSNDSTVMIEFPFRLQSELADFAIAEDMHVRRMDDETKTRLLRIEKAQYDSNGRLINFTALSGCLFTGDIGPNPDTIDEFCSSNYVLTAESRERGVEFNFALKLARNSCSALYIGFKPSGAMFFLTPPCYYGRSALVVNHQEAERLSRLVAQTALGRNDSKLQTMSDIYMHALSGELRNESRFIEMAVILEMLVLPSSSAELSYQFSLRLAKLMSKQFGESVAAAFEQAKLIYEHALGPRSPWKR